MRVLTVIILILSLSIPLHAAWLTDPLKASALAKKENKSLLILFTKSTASADLTDAKEIAACHKLTKQILVQPDFTAYAQAHLVLLKIDYSPDAALNDSERQVNDQMLRYFIPPITTYPTLLITRADWTELARREGPQPGDLSGFLLWLQQNETATPTPH